MVVVVVEGGGGGAGPSLYPHYGVGSWALYGAQFYVGACMEPHYCWGPCMEPHSVSSVVMGAGLLY